MDGRARLSGLVPAVTYKESHSDRSESNLELHLLPKPKELLITKGEFLRFGGKEPLIRKSIDSSVAARLGPEGYTLTISRDRVDVLSGTERGLFYGSATLGQILEQSPNGCIPVLTVCDWPDMPIRGLHLDFRVQRPKLEYCKSILERLAAYKVNTVVIEYEDNFPYDVDRLIPSPHAYTSLEIEEIVTFAREHHIEVIPLQQCLGHVGYILKHNRYASLRELKHQVDMFCPRNPDVMSLLERLFSDMIAAHPGSRYIHIGADETRFLGRCEACRQYVEQHSISELYVDYISQVCELVGKLGRQPMLWGDMLVSYPDYIDRLPEDAVIHHWDYYSYGDEPNVIHNGYLGEDLTHPMGVGFKVYDRLRELGMNVIGGPSSRCAPDSSFSIDNTFHLRNISGFCRKAAEVKGPGIINTSWSNSGDYTTSWADYGGGNDQVINARLEHRRLPLECNWYGLVAGAAFSWSSNADTADFCRDFNHCFFGTKSDAAEAIHLLDARPQNAEQYAAIQRNAIQARRLLGGVGDIGRNCLALDFIRFAARLIEHKSRREQVFHRYEISLSEDPQEAASAKAAMYGLRREGNELQIALHDLWENSYEEDEIEAEVYAHFCTSEIKYDRYLGPQQ